MAGQRKRMQPYYAVLEDAGVEVLEVRRNKHHHVTGSYRGKQVICTIPQSPSDWRGFQRFRHDIRVATAAIDGKIALDAAPDKA